MCLAVPVQITDIFEDQTARVTLNNVERTISLVMTPDAQPGDYVLVHTGYAISILDPQEARDSLQVFDELATYAGDEDTA